MFGAVIYLPLFMPGVLGTSATQSGNLLTPLLMGAVAGAIIGGQTVSRTGEYKSLGIVGSILLAVGMTLFARMTGDTTHSYVVAAMVVAGLGMGLLQPIYTIAVQNVAGGAWQGCFSKTSPWAAALALHNAKCLGRNALARARACQGETS